MYRFILTCFFVFLIHIEALEVAYVVNVGIDAVNVIDVDTDSVIGTITIGAADQGVAISSDATP